MSSAESLETIPVNAFQGCTGLTSITISSNVQSIGDSAFQGCTSLETVIFGSGLTTIGTSFQGLTNLTTVDMSLATSFETIPENAFQGCTGLTSFTLGSGVTDFDSTSFQGCSNLEEFIIGEGLTSIPSNAFKGCIKLSNINMRTNNIGNLKRLEDQCFSINYDDDSSSSELTYINIPSSVVYVGSQLFIGHQNGITNETITVEISEAVSYTHLTLPTKA